MVAIVRLLKESVRAPWELLVADVQVLVLGDFYVVVLHGAQSVHDEDSESNTKSHGGRAPDAHRARSVNTGPRTCAGKPLLHGMGRASERGRSILSRSQESRHFNAKDCFFEAGQQPFLDFLLFDFF